MSDRTFVIVGARLAGAMAAAGPREQGFDGWVVPVRAEREAPYERVHEDGRSYPDLHVQHGVELALGGGLQIDNGTVVDESLRSSANALNQDPAAARARLTDPDTPLGTLAEPA